MKASPAKSRPTCWGEWWNSSWRGTTTTGASCTKSVGTDSKTRYAAATIGGPKEASCTNKPGQQFFDWKSNHHQSQTSEVNEEIHVGSYPSSWRGHSGLTGLTFRPLPDVAYGERKNSSWPTNRRRWKRFKSPQDKGNFWVARVSQHPSTTVLFGALQLLPMLCATV